MDFDWASIWRFAMYTPKENFFAVLEHEVPEWTPICFFDSFSTGFGSLPGPGFEKGDPVTALDGFGIKWAYPASGGGAPVPEPGSAVMTADDILDWESIITFPDVDAFDWDSYAENEYALAKSKGIDFEKTPIDFGSGNGPFERLAALMSFEEALLAIATEPEASKALIERIVDYKIQVAERAREYLHADMFTSYDDTCTQRMPFVSPEQYREVIKPGTTRLYDAVKDLGMYPISHCCGFVEPLLEDMIETGAAAWTSAQPCNDLAGIIRKYDDRFTVIGGFDSNGPAGLADADDETIVADVVRCFDEYANADNGRGYIFWGFRMPNSTDPADKARENGRVYAAAIKIAKERSAARQ